MMDNFDVSDWHNFMVFKINCHEMYEWCEENLIDEWCSNRALKHYIENNVRNDWALNGNYPVWVKDKIDAVAFKLRWT